MADRKNRRKFWTTDEEDRIIDYKMEQVGFSNFGAFARKMLICGLIVKTDMAVFDDVARDISGATKNINQIAKKVNASGRITQEDLARIKEAQRKIWQSLKYMAYLILFTIPDIYCTSLSKLHFSKRSLGILLTSILSGSTISDCTFVP